MMGGLVQQRVYRLLAKEEAQCNISLIIQTKSNFKLEYALQIVVSTSNLIFTHFTVMPRPRELTQIYRDSLGWDPTGQRRASGRRRPTRRCTEARPHQPPPPRGNPERRSRRKLHRLFMQGSELLEGIVMRPTPSRKLGLGKRR